MSIKTLTTFAFALLSVVPLAADSGRPVGTRVYSSASGDFELEVDPRWDAAYSGVDPLLTLRRWGIVVWRRTSADFESFDFPMHALVSNDGSHLVFGGYAVHNMGNYDEGLRIYDAAGRLVRLVSRLWRTAEQGGADCPREAPPGPSQTGVTTSRRSFTSTSNSRPWRNPTSSSQRPIRPSFGSLKWPETSGRLLRWTRPRRTVPRGSGRRGGLRSGRSSQKR